LLKAKKDMVKAQKLKSEKGIMCLRILRLGEGTVVHILDPHVFLLLELTSSQARRFREAGDRSPDDRERSV
jgi:hypothetical protein